MYLIYHVTSQNHPIYGSCKIVVTDIVVVERYALVYYMIYQDDMIKGSCGYMDRSPQGQITRLPSLVRIGTVAV